MLPYFLGCPSWSEAAWRGSLYPADMPATASLATYCQVFNAVEGNTTFYARPAPTTLARWAEQMPAHFHFCAKLPREISHSASLFEQGAALGEFLQLLAPLGSRVTPLWLQLPASFGPSRLTELAWLLEQLADRAVAVEVRHAQFFDRGEAERALNRLLLERGVERICLDSRALFSCTDGSPAIRHAQGKKPRLPVRPTAFSDFPQLRFIGHPLLEANLPFLQPWLDKVAQWIEADKQPHVFLHTPDNHRAPELACLFHRQLQQRLPGLVDLPELPGARQDQLALL